jgi:hypothetical protein
LIYPGIFLDAVAEVANLSYLHHEYITRRNFLHELVMDRIQV